MKEEEKRAKEKREDDKNRGRAIIKHALPKAMKIAEERIAAEEEERERGRARRNERKRKQKGNLGKMGPRRRQSEKGDGNNDATKEKVEGARRCPREGK